MSSLSLLQLNSTCPLDRSEIATMDVYLGWHGLLLKKCPVASRRNGKGPEEVEQDQQVLQELEEGACEICGQGDREDTLLICDSCQLMYHLECLETPLRDIPEGDWFCENCAHLSSFGLNVNLNIRQPENSGARLPRTLRETRERGGSSSRAGAHEPEGVLQQHEAEVARSQLRRTDALHRFAAARSTSPWHSSPSFQRGLRELARARVRRRTTTTTNSGRGRLSPTPLPGPDNNLEDSEDSDSDAASFVSSPTSTDGMLDFRGTDEDRERADPGFSRKRRARDRRLKEKETKMIVAAAAIAAATASEENLQPPLKKRRSQQGDDFQSLSKRKLEKKIGMFGSNPVPEEYLFELAKKEAQESFQKERMMPPNVKVRDPEDLRLIRDKAMRNLVSPHTSSSTPNSTPSHRPSSSLMIFQNDREVTPQLLRRQPTQPPRPHMANPLTPTEHAPPVNGIHKDLKDEGKRRLLRAVSLEHRGKVLELVKTQLNEPFRAGIIDKDSFKALAKKITEEVLDPSIPWSEIPALIKGQIEENI